MKCLAQEHNTMSPARARTRSARSGVERTNHEANAPSRSRKNWCNRCVVVFVVVVVFLYVLDYECLSSTNVYKTYLNVL